MSTNPWQTSVAQVRGEWGWFLALGIFLVLLGMFGVAEPFYFTKGIIFISGFLVLFGGGAHVGQAFYARRWSGFLLQILLGILDIIVGIFMVSQPAEAVELLTLLIAAWFLAGGLFRMVGSLVMRFPNWGWTAFSGFITALLGLAILLKWPESGEFFIGLFVGISLLFQGWSWIMLGLSLRSLPPAPTP